MPRPARSSRSTLSGVVNLHKPPGMTSRAAVDVVKNLVQPARTGHAGTLDPLAEGVLVVCVGAATRLIEHVQRLPKRYRATFLLGRSSPSEDIEGEVTLLPDAAVPEQESLVSAAARLTGEIMQRPPAFSALRVGGKRAYDLARAGREVELAPRPITIHALDILAYDYPELVVDIRCSSGTYVRSLGRDLAESVGTAAVMAALVRTEIGHFTLENAFPCEQLQRENRDAWLCPAIDAVRDLPRVQLTGEQLATIRNGQSIRLSDSGEGATLDPDLPEVAGLDPSGQLVAILINRARGIFGPRVNLLGGN